MKRSESFINYFGRKVHSDNARNNNLFEKFPKMEKEFGCKSFCVAAANPYSKILVSVRQIDSRVLFRKRIYDLNTRATTNIKF